MKNQWSYAMIILGVGVILNCLMFSPLGMELTSTLVRNSVLNDHRYIDVLKDNSYSVVHPKDHTFIIGSAFVVVYKDQKYILTNEHVCTSDSENDIYVFKSIDPTQKIKRHKILFSDWDIDICVTEYNDNDTGLFLSDENEIFQREMFNFGSSWGELPRIRNGFFVENETRKFPFLITSDSRLELCVSRNYKILVNQFDKTRFCLKPYNAVRTDINGGEGASGSAVTSREGSVVGMAMGVDLKKQQLIIIPVIDIKYVLEETQKHGH